MYNDVMFIDAFLTHDFVREYKFFQFDYNPRSGYYEITDRDFHAVKQRLLAGLTNWGQPFIYVEDGNYRNRGELLLRHKHEGVDLNAGEAMDTLANIQHIWNRPVNLESIFDGKREVLHFDGKEHKTIPAD